MTNVRFRAGGEWPELARDAYGVVLGDGPDYPVDEAATARRRQELRSHEPARSLTDHVSRHPPPPAHLATIEAGNQEFGLDE